MNFWWMVNPFLWFTSNDWCVIDSIWERVDDRQKHLPFRWFPLVKLKTLTDSFERTLLLPFLIAFFFLSLFFVVQQQSLFSGWNKLGSSGGAATVVQRNKGPTIALLSQQADCQWQWSYRLLAVPAMSVKGFKVSREAVLLYDVVCEQLLSLSY